MQMKRGVAQTTPLRIAPFKTVACLIDFTKDNRTNSAKVRKYGYFLLSLLLLIARTNVAKANANISAS